ncbi:FHA domain-containing protein [Cyanobacteria bacterium FACHB-471]|nr:FHA domain-containing protein [Cyanobacteria bacterium FACHB-471]
MRLFTPSQHKLDMINANFLAEYSSELLDTVENTELKQRLGLYQLFLKLYEHHRELLDEILNLENSRGSALPGMMFPYIQGVVLNRQIYLTTNLRDGTTQMLSQPQNTWIIGRDSRQVTLPIADKRLSRCHAVIRYVDHQGFYLTDLNSSNGSYVNGEKVQRSLLLKDGDRVRLGSLTLVFLSGNESQSMENLSAEMIERLSLAESLPSGQPQYCAHCAGKPDLTSVKRPPVTALEETMTFMRDKFSM